MNEKLKEALKKFPQAELLYHDFKYSVIGLIITLVGLIIAMFEGSIVIPQFNYRGRITGKAENIIELKELIRISRKA